MRNAFYTERESRAQHNGEGEGGDGREEGEGRRPGRRRLGWRTTAQDVGVGWGGGSGPMERCLLISSPPGATAIQEAPDPRWWTGNSGGGPGSRRGESLFSLFRHARPTTNEESQRRGSWAPPEPPLCNVHRGSRQGHSRGGYSPRLPIRLDGSAT